MPLTVTANDITPFGPNPEWLPGATWWIRGESDTQRQRQTLIIRQVRATVNVVHYSAGTSVGLYTDRTVAPLITDTRFCNPSRVKSMTLKLTLVAP